ncbi:hypothetical protein [Capnocytophaga canis]|uniref:hypothetical protein n=1 Tax=Capnocytophaga canis TaxID=1848903 RepID=UPI0037D65AF3
MTTVEMLASLEAQIRNDIPRLTELREGCYLKHNIASSIYKIYCVDHYNYRLFRPSDKEIWILSKELLEKSLLKKEIFEIIGHDIMLNDVLEWLGKVLKEATEYRIGYTNIGKFGVKYREMLGVMDLSKPLLKDQSEYFIKFLYEFKNEHFRI